MTANRCPLTCFSADRAQDRQYHVPALSVDIEGGYASDLDTLAANAHSLAAAGAVGLNIEDADMTQGGLLDPEDQAARIAALRAALPPPFFINARTDVFFVSADTSDHATRMGAVLARTERYAAAGTDGIFVPGLNDPDLITRLCRDCPLPINVMIQSADDIAAMATCGVARVSFGPAPYIAAMQDFRAKVAEITG